MVETKYSPRFFVTLCMSLTEANLAALEAANPPVARARVEDESTVSSGVDSNGHSKKNEQKVNTMEKWCVGALRALGKTEADLVVPQTSFSVCPLYATSLAPNNELCSRVLDKLADSSVGFAPRRVASRSNPVAQFFFW